MKYERPQRGNPQELTINQHVFSFRSFARFVDSDGRIAVRRPPDASEELRVAPDAALFCAMRVWDHGAESGFMKEIEDRFQGVAEQIVGVRQSLADDQHMIVTEFFALWAARAHLKANRTADAPIAGIEGKQVRHTPDDQELLEKNGIGTSTKN